MVAPWSSGRMKARPVSRSIMRSSRMLFPDMLYVLIRGIRTYFLSL